eukprot:GHVT01000528.1.p1 GENE.GHVT01000528.1~~GHVT01000528.1.p1  ORF type:complete len:106 (+),score=3.07 GHVT01000528.1:275-592(+)
MTERSSPLSKRSLAVEQIQRLFETFHSGNRNSVVHLTITQNGEKFRFNGSCRVNHKPFTSNVTKPKVLCWSNYMLVTVARFCSAFVRPVVVVSRGNDLHFVAVFR